MILPAGTLPKKIQEAKEVEISLLLVGKSKIKALNFEYRGKDQVTDVLSFPANEFQNSVEDPVKVFFDQNSVPFIPLGDIVICKDLVVKQAIEGGWTPPLEVLRLFIHGLFHLFGYDHELSEEHEKEQFELEKLLLEQFKFPKDALDRWVRH